MTGARARIRLISGAFVTRANEQDTRSASINDATGPGFQTGADVMKNAVTTLVILAVILITVAVMSQPEIPANDCTVNNEDLAKLCLSYIPKYYDAGYLTYLGHTKAWVFRWSDKLGVSLGQQQTGYLVKYSSLEDAVNCYLTASGDTSLNMTLPPTEFTARFESIASDFGIRK